MIIRHYYAPVIFEAYHEESDVTQFSELEGSYKKDVSHFFHYTSSSHVIRQIVADLLLDQNTSKQFYIFCITGTN